LVVQIGSHDFPDYAEEEEEEEEEKAPYGLEHSWNFYDMLAGEVSI
jgi:hypothetical protein